MIKIVSKSLRKALGFPIMHNSVLYSLAQNSQKMFISVPQQQSVGATVEHSEHFHHLQVRLRQQQFVLCLQWLLQNAIILLFFYEYHFFFLWIFFFF